MLYRDLAYFNGPLSPYVNAVWFWLFGVSLRVLALANFAIVGVILFLLYRLLSQVGSRTSAFVACLTFVLLFGFSRYSIVGNYNYICPYSHEMTHGLALSLAAMYFVGRYAHDGKVSDVALCGACVGLVFLTKPEILAAVASAAPVGLALAWWSRQQLVATLPATVAAFAGAMLVPPLVAVALLSLAMPAREALDCTLGGFRWVFSAEITSLPFYRESMGLLQPLAQVRTLLEFLLWYVVLLGVPAVLGFAWRRLHTGQMVAAVACFVAVSLLAFAGNSRHSASQTLRVRCLCAC